VWALVAWSEFPWSCDFEGWYNGGSVQGLCSVAVGDYEVSVWDHKFFWFGELLSEVHSKLALPLTQLIQKGQVFVWDAKCERVGVDRAVSGFEFGEWVVVKWCEVGDVEVNE